MDQLYLKWSAQEKIAASCLKLTSFTVFSCYNIKDWLQKFKKNKFNLNLILNLFWNWKILIWGGKLQASMKTSNFSHFHSGKLTPSNKWRKIREYMKVLVANGVYHLKRKKKGGAGSKREGGRRNTRRGIYHAWFHQHCAKQIWFYHW